MKTMLGVPITHDHIQQLLQEKKTPMIEGFISKRTGKPFTAALALKSDGNLRFVFSPRASHRKSSESAL
jgi:DNA topoisomerase-3